MAKANPLQEQLLKAGLVKKSQVAQVAREQNKARHAKGAPAGPSDSQREAERVRAEKAERDRMLEVEVADRELAALTATPPVPPAVHRDAASDNATGQEHAR